MKEVEKIFHANGNQKKARVAIFISNKIVFKTKTVLRDKEGHYIMIKGSIQHVYKYAPHTGAPKHIKQILTDPKGEIIL